MNTEQKLGTLNTFIFVGTLFIYFSKSVFISENLYSQGHEIASFNQQMLI